MKRLVLFTATALALAIPLAASATGGFIRSSINLRAGPGWDYPRVASTQSGERIDILGCTGGWRWCDVSTGPQRGWVAGSYVQFDYQGRLVPVFEYGERIGVPVVTFQLGNYWDTYYRGRDFYGDRDRWDRSHGHDHEHRPGGWDRNHYRNDGDGQGHDRDHGHDGDHSHDGDRSRTTPPPRVVPMPHPIPDPPRRRTPEYPSSDRNDRTSVQQDNGNH